MSPAGKIQNELVAVLLLNLAYYMVVGKILALRVDFAFKVQYLFRCSM